MSVNVTGNKITMTRGDTLRVRVNIDVDDAAYTPVEGDVVRFYLKHDLLNSKKTAYKDPTPLIEKIVPIETMLLNLASDDTKALEFGEYVYDLEITFANGVVDTFINNEKFTLVPEVG